MRASALVCIVGWLAIFFAQVHFDSLFFLCIIPLSKESWWWCASWSKFSECCFTWFWEILHRVWRGGVFIRGMIIIAWNYWIFKWFSNFTDRSSIDWTGAGFHRRNSSQGSSWGAYNSEPSKYFPLLRRIGSCIDWKGAGFRSRTFSERSEIVAWIAVAGMYWIICDVYCRNGCIMAHAGHSWYIHTNGRSYGTWFCGH